MPGAAPFNAVPEQFVQIDVSLSDAEMIFKKKKTQFLCVIVSFHLACELSKWHKIFLCFMALQGESWELEKCPVWFNNVVFFYWCALFVIRLWMAATVVIARVESWLGNWGIITEEFDVWYKEKIYDPAGVLISKCL